MKISHLITNGCSWTYGLDLPSPLTQSWPARLSALLGLPVVNLAIPGSGNDSIYRRTAEYLSLDLAKEVKPLVVIAWSQYWRTEFWHKPPTHSNIRADYSHIFIPDDGSEMTPTQKSLLDQWDDEFHFKRAILIKFAMYNLLRNFNIPYIMCDYTGNWREYKEKVSIKDSWYEGLINFLEKDSNHLSFPLHEISQSYPRINTHDGPEGSSAIAERLKYEIELRYQPEPDNEAEYYTLKDYCPYRRDVSHAERNIWELYDQGKIRLPTNNKN